MVNSTNINKGVYIPSLQAKDIFNANNLVADKNKKRITGYSTRNNNGRGFNTKRYINSLDYSLDFIKIKELCEEKEIKFSFGADSTTDKKSYSNVVVNVNFDLIAKAYNQYGNIYSKFGYQYSHKSFDTPFDTPNEKNTTIISYEKKDGIVEMREVAVKYDTGVILVDGELTGIIVDSVIDDPVDAATLGKYFTYNKDLKCYKRTSTEIPAVSLAVNGEKFRGDIRSLRKYLYEHGFYVNGTKYVRWKRSAGSSRLGKCLFVDRRLYADLNEYDRCGLEINAGDAIDLASYEASIALSISSIIDTISIRKENILIINDHDSIFVDKVIAVGSSDRGELAAERNTAQIKNSIWDGQSLIDVSLMGEYRGKGMILLRNRFFKSCCFNANVQQFFKEHGITSVRQLNGFTLADKIEDVKLIVTPNSIKYQKFGGAGDGRFGATEGDDGWKVDWFNNYLDTFGIVKYDKPTPYFDGNLVQLSYQMLNCLQANRQQIEMLLQPTIKFMERLRDDHLAVKYYIDFQEEQQTDDDAWKETSEDECETVSSKNDLICKLLDANCEFHLSSMFHEFKRDLIGSLTKKVERGNLLVRGIYSTVCGNPIEMLYHAVLSDNGISLFENNGYNRLVDGDNIIYNTKYDFDKTLFAARNPFITMGNAWLVTNKDNELIRRYMNSTDEIVYINAIGENVLQRNNGMDFDSDTIALVNEPLIIELAQMNYYNFLVPTSLIEGIKTARTYTDYELADLDSKTAINKIGKIVNLSQELNSGLWHNANNDPSYEIGRASCRERV